MRRVNLRRMTSFITREHTLDINTIRSLFIAEHEKHLELNPTWNFKATRISVIGTYWFRMVLLHFGLNTAISVPLTLTYCDSWRSLFAAILIGGIPALFSLTAFIYFPSFYWNFLPKLEVITGEQEKLAIQVEEPTKCKRTQYQAPLKRSFYQM